MNKLLQLHADDRFLMENLSSFLPERLFDVHAHLYRLEDLGPGEKARLLTEGPAIAGYDTWASGARGIFPRAKTTSGLFFPYPSAGTNIEAANRFLFEQIKADTDSRGLAVIAPETDRTHIETLLDHPQMAGFKPYYTFARPEATFNARIGDFLPEWALEIANEHRFAVTLHMVKERALADPDNLRDIRNMCERYPRMQLVLAHAARGFNAYHTKEAAAALRGLENIWFDTAAICESGAVVALLDEFGPGRVMWGSDFPISHLRGKAVSLADGFFWIQDETIRTDGSPNASPTLTVVESLRAMRDAADIFGLNRDDLDNLFYGNAQRLLALDTPEADAAQKLYGRAKALIPGGVHLLSKSPSRYAPGAWPAHFVEARGCETWDVEGRHFYDMATNGIGSCLLGFRDPDVTRAVKRRINLGSMSTLNPVEEVALAEKLCDIHPWADSVRFSRTGGETAVIAVRIARATTNRSVVVICGYHGWHDWYLAANLGENDALDGHLLPGLTPLGVPKELRGTTLHFAYNKPDELDAIIASHGDRIAAVIMEPCRNSDPAPGFLEHVRDSAHKVGALLIFDEITIGFRLTFAGSHLKFGVNPDIAIYAKALGNGHPIGAVVGTAEAMEGANESFISSTYWTESVGPTAAVATLEKLERLEVPAYVDHIGSAIKKIWREAAQAHDLPVVVSDGYSCLAHFHFDHEKSLHLSALFTRLMLEHGFLAATGVYPTMAHTDKIVRRYGEAVDAVFGTMAQRIENDSLEDIKPIQAGFGRLVD